MRYKQLSILHLLVVSIITKTDAQVVLTKHVIDGQFNGACSVFAADLNGDSLVDVLGAAWDGNTIALWENNGDHPITWTKQTISNNFRGASYVSAADLDGDGDLDVLGSAWDDNELAWWRNEGGNPVNWVKQTIDSNFRNAHEILAVDLDNDGDLDVLGAAAGANTIAWWKNDGAPNISWTKRVIGSAFGGARSVTIGDVDDDGDLDVAGAAFTANEISLWLQENGNTWTKQILDASFAGAHKVHIRDLDGDGDLDILGAGYYADAIHWWRNDQGNPILWTKQTITGNFNGALSVYTADIDRDGALDALGAAEIAGKVSWWRNESGNATQWVEYTVDGAFPGAWPAMAVDMDRDGDMDILSAAGTVDDVAWWENESLVKIEREPLHPTGFNLFQNYPNPFNSRTRIDYYLSKDADIRLTVYSLLGKQVKTLINGKISAGYYSIEWDGRDKEGHRLASGSYLYHVVVDGQLVRKKLVLIK